MVIRYVGSLIVVAGLFGVFAACSKTALPSSVDSSIADSGMDAAADVDIVTPPAEDSGMGEDAN